MKRIYISSVLIFIAITFIACSKKISFPLEYPHQSIAMDVLTLASDDMEGREVGTQGEQKAAEYIAQRYKEIGLQPAGDNGTFYQIFTKKKNKNPHAIHDEPDAEVVTGRNIIGYIDNNADFTVVIGAHYDHLGYGKEGSLYFGVPAIHNGADDNASGVAGVLYIAESLKKKNLNQNNYLFVCFSGEEKGLWGSNYFVNNKIASLKTPNYMVNMDMIGRMNKERKISVGGIGTSPDFDKTIVLNNFHKFDIKKELSGLGPSDHASFYNAGIPVLSFFTGQHEDYHKPSDDAQFINYKGLREVAEYIYLIIKDLDDNGPLPFVKTQDDTKTRSAFKVTLGVMPDYLYDEKGMKIDGVRDGKPAAHAGILKGDIIIKMGDYDILSMEDYMQSLSKFDTGQTIQVEVLRDGKSQILQVTF